VAADAEQVGHVMSQTSSERRRFPLPLRRLNAGGNLSRPDSRRSRRPEPLIRSKRRRDALLTLAPAPACSHPGRLAPVSRPPSNSALTSNPHSARCPAHPTSRDFVPRRFLNAGSLSVRSVSLLPASKNLYVALAKPGHELGPGEESMPRSGRFATRATRSAPSGSPRGWL
jgi:hypothetical protein